MQATISSAKRLWPIWAAAVLGSALRFWHWGAPLTFDEAYTLRHYAPLSPLDIAATYDFANNHVLLSLILHALGPADIRVLQLPSILGAGLSLFLMASLAGELAGPAAAFLSTVVLSISFWPLLYSHMLRGYSLSLYLNLFNLWLVLRFLRYGSRTELLLLAAGTWAAHYLMPTNAVYSLALLGWGLAAGRGRERRMLTAAVLGGFFLAGLSYWPVRAQLLQSSRTQLAHVGAWAGMGPRLGEYFHVLGYGRLFPLILGLGAAAGLAFSLLVPSRRMVGFLILLYLGLPTAVFTLQGTAPPARVYMSTLPFWALAYALAAERACRGRAWTVACLLTALAALPQMRRFLSWNRGLDPGRALQEVLSKAADTDDFCAIYSDRGDEPGLAGEVNWDYYGFKANLEPYWQLMPHADYPYLARGRYFVLAQDEPQARQALERTGIWNYVSGLKAGPALGRLRLYESVLDPASPLGAAHQALSRGEFPRAIVMLEKAKSANAANARIRNMLGMAYYLSFQDRKAEEEFAWAVSHDPANVHAPFYYADVLSERGDDGKAALWYSWYFQEGRPPGAWVYRARAERGLAALRQKKARVPTPGGKAEDWDRAGLGFFVKGSLERSSLAFEKAHRLAPSRARLEHWLAADMSRHAYAAAIARLERAAAGPGGEDFQGALAAARRLKGLRR
ncbi:MAG: hypothetical protein HY921_05190 [Elusimicrobia bacterium]|nr:hypothetical protein [Elusimicrobiota bacterium]